jgi:hypothetical protein
MWRTADWSGYWCEICGLWASWFWGLQPGITTQNVCKIQGKQVIAEAMYCTEHGTPQTSWHSPMTRPFSSNFRLQRSLRLHRSATGAVGEWNCGRECEGQLWKAWLCAAAAGLPERTTVAVREPRGALFSLSSQLVQSPLTLSGPAYRPILTWKHEP